MDKNTVLIVAAVAAVGLFFVLGRSDGGAAPFVGSAGGRGFAGGNVGPDGFPLPEDRVIGVLERLTRLGAEIYDGVQSRSGGGAAAAGARSAAGTSSTARTAGGGGGGAAAGAAAAGASIFGGLGL